MGKHTPPPASPAAQANACLLEAALKRLEGRNDPDLRWAAPRPEVVADLQRQDLAAVQVLERACAAYADRPALGGRAPDGERFQTLPYRDLWERTAALASGWAREAGLRPGAGVGVLGFGGIEYVLTDLACLYAGAVSALLPGALGAEELRQLVREAGLAALACTPDDWPLVREALPACPTVRSVLVMEAGSGGRHDCGDDGAPPVFTLAGLEAAGRAAPLAPHLPEQGTDPLATLMYTSGSTGSPKGAMLTHSVWRSHWSLNALSQLVRFPHIGISFYPLSHAMGRLAVLRALVMGGVTHFARQGDPGALFDDIRLARPTFLNLVPRVAEMIHHAARMEELRRVRDGAAPGPAREEAWADLGSRFLGDRLVAAVLGSAPTAPEVVAFLTGCFGIPVYEGYGSTEAGIISIDGEICRPAVTDYRLADASELGYRLDDQPHPRGELLVKTRQCVPGYFRNPAASKALYDPDGFLRTGDIVAELAPGRIQWLDRRNNVVKLAQGEYVALWRLESLYSAGSPLLDQVFLFADSRRSFPLAVVVPEPGAVAGRLARDGQAPTPEAVRRLLRAEFGRVAEANRLRPYEVPRDILVEDERWTRDNGLLTGVDKPARPQLRRKYGERLEALYDRLDGSGRGPAGPGPEAAGGTLADAVRAAAEAVLGVPVPDLDAGSFAALGGDSLHALALASLLEERSGSQVPVSAVLNPGETLGGLARRLEADRTRTAGAMPGFREVHGADPARIREDDLRLDRFLAPADLDGAAAVAARDLPDPVRTVLLTGASGFLGRALALAWLERLAPAGGRVLALVRAPDAAAAASRLATAGRDGDPLRAQRFAALAEGRLEALAGDLARPDLGLAPEVYERLAVEVDLIVHPAALVNHMLDYEQLFSPNVGGTAQVIRLALRRRPKRIDFVSTVGVLAGARAPGRVSELAGVDALQADWPARGGYAHGYALSKWAGEVLLKNLHERFQTPVRVFRCDLLLPDRRYRRQINLPDLMTRLLASVVRTGLAPRSFYAEPRAAHLDALPVDFVAAALVALSSAGGRGHRTYQVSNAHWDDGVSLDTVMDWIQSAGHPLRRMEDHAAWFRAFEGRLRELPAGERQRSALPILERWAAPLPSWERERIDATQFLEQVRRLRPGGESEPPHLTEAYVHAYLADLQDLGLLPPMKAATGAR